MLNFSLASDEHLGEIRSLLSGVQQWLVSRNLSQWIKAFPTYWLKSQIENQHFYLVHYENRSVATFRLLHEDPMFWGEPDAAALYVHTLAVARQAKGLGIGKQILDWVVAKARQEHIPFVRLDCLADNPFLVDYYARYGFVSAGKKWINESEYMLYEFPVDLET